MIDKYIKNLSHNCYYKYNTLKSQVKIRDTHATIRLLKHQLNIYSAINKLIRGVKCDEVSLSFFNSNVKNPSSEMNTEYLKKFIADSTKSISLISTNSHKFL